MIVDPAVLPGLLALALELAALAAFGYVVVRVALRQDDDLSALAQGLVVGPALWGLVVNFVMYAVPGLAGAAVGWGVTLMLGAGLVWRSPDCVRVPARTVAGFAGVILVLGWVALASRQLIGTANPYNDLGMAASVRAGGFPVALPSHPEATGVYHYGANLLVGLLVPPWGPDLAFGWELLSVYAWVSFALVVVAALRQRGSWLTTLALAPLLLSYGRQTFIWNDAGNVMGVLRLPLPTGPPAAGLRASLAETYWAPLEPSGSFLGSLPDVVTPAFALGYAIAVVVLAHAARATRVTLPGSLTLAGLVGFLGLLVTTLAPVVVVLWAGLAAWRLVHVRHDGSAMLASAWPSGAGLAVAGVLLLFGGGALSGIVGGGAGSSGLTWTAGLNAGSWLALGGVEARPGGFGLLRLGPVAVAIAAAALAWRDRLVLALVIGSGLLAVAWVALEYPPRPYDVDRLAGHARNLALVALLLALSGQLVRLESKRWRYAVVGLLVGLLVWPTAAAPARSLGIALGHGVQLANAGWGWEAARAQDDSAALHRQVMPQMSRRVAAYIRAHTAADARVLDTSASLAESAPVRLVTGRPDNWGFDGLRQVSQHWGPEYLDARYYLEPSAFRRLGLAYVYATAAWEAKLPARARHWLADPNYFDPLVRDGDEALYRIQPAFLALQTAPSPNSFEALRAVSPSTLVFLPPQRARENQVRLLRVASALSHTRLAGTVNEEPLHILRTPAPWVVAPPGAQTPDMVALPLLHDAWQYPPSGWREVWRNVPGGVAVYAPPPPGTPVAAAAPSPVSVELSDVHTMAARLTFTARLDVRPPLDWMGQDWVLVPADSSPWAIPELRLDGRPVIEQWFAGQAAAGAETTTHTYTFDARDSSLAVRGAEGGFTTVQASQRVPESSAWMLATRQRWILASKSFTLQTTPPGVWMLALRLNRWVDQGVQEPAFIVPVLRIGVAESGTVSYQVYDVARGWQPA